MSATCSTHCGEEICILWQVNPLLANDREISKYATAVTE
jgi:hypothetical protein